MHECIHVCMYVCMYMYACTHYAHVCIIYMHVCRYNVFMYMYAYVIMLCMHLCVHVCIHVCIRYVCITPIIRIILSIYIRYNVYIIIDHRIFSFSLTYAPVQFLFHTVCKKLLPVD